MVLSWLRSFLTDLSQRVAYAGELSVLVELLFGVPMGGATGWCRGDNVPPLLGPAGYRGYRGLSSQWRNYVCGALRQDIEWRPHPFPSPFFPSLPSPPNSSTPFPSLSPFLLPFP